MFYPYLPGFEFGCWVVSYPVSNLSVDPAQRLEIRSTAKEIWTVGWVRTQANAHGGHAHHTWYPDNVWSRAHFGRRW